MTDVVFRSRDCYRADGTPKKRYEKRSEAKRDARQIGQGCRYYVCPHCRFWHVGHPPGRNQ